MYTINSIYSLKLQNNNFISIVYLFIRIDTDWKPSHSIKKIKQKIIIIIILSALNPIIRDKYNVMMCVCIIYIYVFVYTSNTMLRYNWTSIINQDCVIENYSSSLYIVKINKFTRILQDLILSEMHIVLNCIVYNV